MDGGAPNICAGPFGALYNFYIEQPQLMHAIGRMVWGIDASVLYDSMRLAEIEGGKTVLDVPCGGGVAFRALPQGRNIRYVAIDIDEVLLARARVRVQRRGLEAEFVAGDMLKLPFDDGEADLVFSYSGLHMVSDPERAVQELARCLRPGGHLIGTTFLAGETRRSQALFGIGARQGHPLPPAREDLICWLKDAGIADATIGPQPRFAAFNGHRA